ncbi:YycC family protein [Peribacillus psychrosaccharolyticus]|uniref:YycC family protein n=1 Tax=Peribacillus psychrosaccharolyticus TaxID=1407 RepID=UPI0002D5C313
MRPLQISAETAVKLAETLNLPLEQIMHMPAHILVAKMAEAEKLEKNKDTFYMKHHPASIRLNAG